MRVIRCHDRDREAWNTYVASRPQASFYHLYEWRAINADSFGHRSTYLAAFDDDGAVGGILPLVQLKSRLFGNIACSLPFVNYGGPCADRPDVDLALLAEARRVVEEWRADYLEIRSRKPLADRLPAAEHKVSVCVDLDSDPEAVFARFDAKHRSEVRRALKRGFDVRAGVGELLGDFYDVLSESWRDHGTPIYPRHYFERIVSAFPDRIRIMVVYAAGRPAAAAFMGLHGDTVEGMWLGARAEYRRQLVNYVLYWESIKDVCRLGYRQYHLGRSTADSSAEAFKRKWSPRVTQLYWTYVLRSVREVPKLNVMNPKFRFAISAWQRLPVSLTQWMGPMIARSIP